MNMCRNVCVYVFLLYVCAGLGRSRVTLMHDIGENKVTVPGYYFFKSNFGWFMCLDDICLHSSGC